MHILRAPVGGLFRHVCDLVEAQAHSGNQVGLICDAATGGETAARRISELSAHCALGVARIHMSRFPTISDVGVLREVRSIGRQWRAEIVHGHGAKGGLYARLAFPDGAHKPARIYTPHGGSLHYSFFSPSGAAYLVAERLLRWRCEAILFESQFSAHAYRRKIGTPRAHYAVVHNGVHPAELKPISADEPQTSFVFVGELRQLKGVDLLIEALARVHITHPGTALTIVGDGPDRAKLQRQSIALGVADKVQFLGEMPARQAFAKGRFLVVPSRKEAFPYIVLEALAAKVPVIATQVGGIEEMFGDVRGLLIKPDDVDVLHRAMITALDQPQHFTDSSEKLQRGIEAQFLATHMAEEIYRHYRMVLDRDGGRS